ncbi:MAG: hypothetical protein LC750_12175 [Actinobacteria bacterium]|nr:hypothetical protein [Actinomycetota bacterium]
MSLLSAGLVVALLLGAAAVTARLISPLTGGVSHGVVRLNGPSETAGGQGGRTAAAGRSPTASTRAFPKSHPVKHRQRHTTHESVRHESPGGSSGSHDSSSNGSTNVQVHAGPVHGSATVGSSGASVDVDAGPVHVSADTHDGGDVVSDTADAVDQTLCKLAC